VPELTKRVRHLVQLLAEELDRNNVGPWTVMMSGHSLVGKEAWDWRIELGESEDEDWYESNSSTNLADVIPIKRVE
jgi:hypothetical protein